MPQFLYRAAANSSHILNSKNSAPFIQKILLKSPLQLCANDGHVTVFYLKGSQRIIFDLRSGQTVTLQLLLNSFPPSQLHLMAEVPEKSRSGTEEDPLVSYSYFSKVKKQNSKIRTILGESQLHIPDCKSQSYHLSPFLTRFKQT